MSQISTAGLGKWHLAVSPEGTLQAPEKVGAEEEKEDRVVSNPTPMAAPELRLKKTEQNRSCCCGLGNHKEPETGSLHKGLL